MKIIRNFLLGFFSWLLIAGISYYILLPAFNFHSIGFYIYSAVFLFLPAALLFLLSSILSKSAKSKKTYHTIAFIGLALCAFAAVFLSLCQWFNSPMFHAKKYASILPIEDYDFTEDIDEANALSKIALMDTNSARILGNREIGSLSDVVSQFEVSYDYTQIDFNQIPTKVAALEYAGFFKYLANKEEGVPGYVTVDPVAQDASYVTLEKGMIYVPSAYFQKDLYRHLRFQYPTKIFRNLHFEIDEKGHPYYIASTVDYSIGIFGGQTISGAVICDPITGASSYYAAGEIPQWADVIFDGELLTRQYNYYGTLSGGFFNSIMAKKGCKKCTETTNADANGEITASDYGYIAKDGDIWIYTGITSVNDDSSNIGFIMVNERTAEAHYFPIAGADENSAMASAEGEVQEKGYEASFPSLINVKGEPTYIMVLKDSNGIVKLYAMVNVEQYNIVATASTLDDCFLSYQKKLYRKENTSSENQDTSEQEIEQNNTNNPDFSVIPENFKEEDLVTRSFTIKAIQYIEISGNTYVYLTGEEDQAIYKQRFADNEQLILLKTRDKVTAECIETEEGIWAIISFPDSKK